MKKTDWEPLPYAYNMLGLGVEGACRFVQDEDLGVLRIKKDTLYMLLVVPSQNYLLSFC
jgi:hypothetical protein